MTSQLISHPRGLVVQTADRVAASCLSSPLALDRSSRQQLPRQTDAAHESRSGIAGSAEVRRANALHQDCFAPSSRESFADGMRWAAAGAIIGLAIAIFQSIGSVG